MKPAEPRRRSKIASDPSTSRGIGSESASWGPIVSSAFLIGPLFSFRPREGGLALGTTVGVGSGVARGLAPGALVVLLVAGGGAVGSGVPGVWGLAGGGGGGAVWTGGTAALTALPEV